jgi:DNA-binding IclR family transcriptional regulator
VAGGRASGAGTSCERLLTELREAGLVEVDAAGRWALTASAEAEFGRAFRDGLRLLDDDGAGPPPKRPT